MNNWLTVREVVQRYHVKEGTVRHAIREDLVGHRRESRQNRRVLVVLEDDACNGWPIREETLLDLVFAEHLESFDEIFPGGDDQGHSAKQQFERAVFGQVGENNGEPRRLSLAAMAESAVGSAVGGGAILAAAAFIKFLNDPVASRTIDGKWESNWGELVLECRGCDVSGGYSYAGENERIHGSIVGKSAGGNKITGAWRESGANSRGSGTFSWMITNDRKAFLGTWEADDGESGDWTGKRA